MADQSLKKNPSIPEWQKQFNQSPTSSTAETDHTNTVTVSPPASSRSELSLLEQARLFLDDEVIRDAPRERKVAFLQKKGVQPDNIEKLLGSELPSPSGPSSSSPEPELKTVHESNSNSTSDEKDVGTSSEPKISPQPSPVTSATVRHDVPPVIIYPEFLLKPQKPPPLVTFERLINAAYALAGISALTYGASKYIVQPMLESLTEARHDLAEGAKQDLQKLNSKLESSVSHVPYIASSTVLQKQKEQNDQDDDVESIVSDPTELFHRDVATQISPQQSRASSSADLAERDPTAHQSSRLRSLHGTLSSLLSSTTTHFSQDRLKESMTDFQGVLDKLESTYNPFRVDYAGTYSTLVDDKNKAKKSGLDNEAAKFKAEIRSLKGAILSSRNFPTARPATPFTPPIR